MPSEPSTKGKTSSTKPSAAVVLNTLVQNEIARLAELHSIDTNALKDFVHFVIENYKKKDPKPKPKPLSQAKLKEAIFTRFGVKDLKTLRASDAFQQATSSMGKINLSKKAGWEILYRKLIGILPEEVNETGYGCINGINIFKYDMPWNAFGLDPKVSTTEDVKSAYRTLSKIYHPDNRESGDAEVFGRLTIFYKSLTEKF